MFGILSTLICFLLPFTCSRNLKEHIKFTNCGPDGSNPSVDISPCDSEPCTFKHGMNATVTINFTAVSDASSLKTQVFGIVAGVPIPFPLPNPNACVGCNLNCPVKEGKKYAYRNVFPVKKEYPSIKVGVKWEIVDENEKAIVCFVFPIEIDD